MTNFDLRRTYDASSLNYRQLQVSTIMLQAGLLFPGTGSIVSTSDKPLPSFSHVKKPPAFISTDDELSGKQELKPPDDSDHSQLDGRQSSEFHCGYFFGGAFNQQAANFRTFDQPIDPQLPDRASVEHFLANPAYRVGWPPFIVHPRMDPLLSNRPSSLPNAASYSSVRFNYPAGVTQPTDDFIHPDAKPFSTQDHKPASFESASSLSSRNVQGTSGPVSLKANKKSESLLIGSIGSSNSLNHLADQLKANNPESPNRKIILNKVDSNTAELTDPQLTGPHLNDPRLSTPPYGEILKETVTNQQVKRLARSSVMPNELFFGLPVRKRADRRMPDLAAKLQGQLRPPRTESARSTARAKKAKKSKQQIAEDEDRKRRKANQQERDRMRKLNTALDMLRQELQKRCVFDLSSSLNSTVTLCLPEHRASKGAGSVSLLVSLKPEKFAWSSDSSESSEPNVPADSTEVSSSSNKAATPSISSKTKKFSKIMTLRLACKYIKLLNSSLGR